MASAIASAARSWIMAGAMGKAVVRAMGSQTASVVRRILVVRTSEDCCGEYQDTHIQMNMRRKRLPK